MVVPDHPRTPIGRTGRALSPRRSPVRVRTVGRVDPRLRALCDLTVPESREYAGRHEYDGRLQDLSPSGVAAALVTRIGNTLLALAPRDALPRG